MWGSVAVLRRGFAPRNTSLCSPGLSAMMLFGRKVCRVSKRDFSAMGGGAVCLWSKLWDFVTE